MRLKSMIYGYEQTARLDKSPATIRDDSLTFKRLVAFLDNVEFEKISAGDIAAFAHLADEFELSKKNAGQCLDSLKYIMDMGRAAQSMESTVM